jgi:hypothetical protein
MAWDDIRTGLLMTYVILTADMLVLEGSPVLTNFHFPSDTKSSSSDSETGDQKTLLINNCTYLWPEVSTTAVLPFNFQSKTKRDNMSSHEGMVVARECSEERYERTLHPHKNLNRTQ